MKRFISLFLLIAVIFSMFLVGCNSNGGIETNNSSVENTQNTSSSENIIPITPPSVKTVVTDIKTGGTGKAATDVNSKEAISLTPPDFATSGSIVYNDCADQSTLLTATNATADEYQTYLQKLETNGYVKVMEDRKILNSDNKAAIYSNGKYLISTNFIATNNTVKIAIEPTNCNTVEAVNKYLSAFDTEFSAKSNICEPLFLSVGLSVSENKSDVGYYNTGLSYILRLSDGSFIIIDGGDSAAANDHAGRIYSILKYYAPDKENIRIAAWIITHPHSDHARAFLEFCGSFLGDSTYKVTLEKVVANIPNYEDIMASLSNTHLLINSSLRNSFAACKTRGTDIYKAHTGQVYNFCGATVELFYTYDVSMPQKLAKGMDNTFSLGFMISFEGEKFLINGDMTSIGIIAVNQMYGANLKCDFVQVPHHGTVSNFKSSTNPEKQANNFEQLIKFYTDYTKPSYVLWPSTRTGKDYYLNETLDENPNSVLKTIVPIENIYANGHNIKEFSFKDGNVTVKQYDYSQIGY